MRVDRLALLVVAACGGRPMEPDPFRDGTCEVLRPYEGDCHGDDCQVVVCRAASDALCDGEERVEVPSEAIEALRDLCERGGGTLELEYCREDDVDDYYCWMPPAL